MPGFGLSLGFTLFYLSAIVLVPLAALIIRPWELGWSGFWAEITQPRVLAALKLSFGAAAIAAGVNSVFGLIVAWVLVRYDFPGRSLAFQPAPFDPQDLGGFLCRVEGQCALAITRGRQPRPP